jgi:ribosomal RNA methyltransferase Nop2
MEIGEDDEFDLSEDDEEAGSGFGPDSEDEEEEAEDDGFESSNEGDVDMEGAEDDDEELPPHRRPNARLADLQGEDDDITTNLVDDLTNDGFTLPAVDHALEGGEEEEEGVSLREVEARMRWLVEVLTPREDGEGKIKGVPGK